jgi:hypothetical protein
MIHPSSVHIHSAFLPVYFGGAAFIFHNAGRMMQKRALKEISYRLFMATSLVTTLTCGFGGASIRAVESVKGINPFIVKVHAWTAMAVFILALILAFYSYRAILRKVDDFKTDKTLFIISLAFLLVFICTTIVSFKIR